MLPSAHRPSPLPSPGLEPALPRAFPAGETELRLPLVFYDGECGLCQALVRFLLRHDRRQRLTFAPLQGRTAARLLGAGLSPKLSTLVLLDARGRHERSGAMLRTLAGLGGAWRLGLLLLAVPRPLRDAVYDAVAARRRRGASDAYCLPASAEVRGRLLP